MGSSINDVTVIGGGGQYFCDGSTKAFSNKKRDEGEGGVKNCPKLRDNIYGRPILSYRRCKGRSANFSYDVIKGIVRRRRHQRTSSFKT